MANYKVTNFAGKLCCLGAEKIFCLLCVYSIPLPKWVVEEIERDPDLAYTDQWGRRNYEYVSLGCDTIPVLKGRTPVQCYSDFMRAFRDNFKHLLGDTIVVRICDSSLQV